MLRAILDFFDEALFCIQKVVAADPNAVIRFEDAVARKSHRLDMRPERARASFCFYSTSEAYGLNQRTSEVRV